MASTVDHSQTTPPLHRWGAVGALVCVCVCLLVHTHFAQANETPRVRSRLLVHVTWSIALLAWPVLWVHAIQDEHRTVEALPCLMWPILIIGMDIVALRRSHQDINALSKRSVLAMDANTICSLTFAVSSVIGAQRHECCRKIFMYAIIACIAFVIPAPHSSTDSLDTVVIEAAQKAILAYATGLLLGGIMLTAFKADPDHAKSASG